MRARHLFVEKSHSPREKSRGCGNIVQMKTCTEDIVRLMARLPLFANCLSPVCVELQKTLHIRAKCFTAGEMIVNEAMAARDFLAVCSGRLQVSECGLEDDSRHFVQSLSFGDTFGTGFPVMDIKQYPAMVLAQTEGVLLAIDVVATRQLLISGKNLAFVMNLYAATARQGFYAWRKLTLLSCYEVADRVLLYLRWRREDGHPEPFAINYPELAAYLGVNRTALYRAIAALKKAKKIKQVGQRITAV